MLTFSAVDPWSIELIIVGSTRLAADRYSLSRDVARGLLIRLRRGVYVDRAAFVAMPPEHQHIVRLRALAAVADAPPVFSHQSAAVVDGLPVPYSQLQKIHVTVAEHRHRGQDGVVGHVLQLRSDEVRRVGSLLVTSLARTVIDVAAAAPFDEGVAVADAALSRGLPRDALEAAIELAGPRRAGRRIVGVVDFAHPGAESAAESKSRTSLLHLGFPPPALQHRIVLDDGAEVFLDMLFEAERVGGEVDGAVKLLDPVISPEARRALLREKRREDALRLRLSGLARWGWQEANAPSRLQSVLQFVGVGPATPRAVLLDYAAAARAARPRRAPSLYA